MPEETIETQTKRALENTEAVRSTVFEVGDVEIKLSTFQDVSIVSVSGPYSPRVAREIERAARRVRGSLGLEFVDDPKRPGAASTFDPSVIRLLNLLEESCGRRGVTFFLCTPPPKLEDMLTLAGLKGRYRIVDRSGTLSSSGKASPTGGSTRSTRGRSRGASRANADPIGTSKRIYQLNTSLKRTESLEKGLDSAEKCVMKFLPSQPPEAPGYDFSFFYKSCEKIGGDFFDFVPLDDSTLGVTIGDVSGHGIDAALIMGMTKKLLSIRASDMRDALPSEVLCQVNEDVSKDLNRRTFVTALYGKLHLDTGEFLFARAGHEPPLLSSPTGVRDLTSNGVALGLGVDRFFRSQIEDARVVLSPGSALLLVTDGVAECRNEKEAIFSRERLSYEYERVSLEHSAEQRLDQLLGVVQSFAGTRTQEDDMTALVIQRSASSTDAASSTRNGEI